MINSTYGAKSPEELRVHKEQEKHTKIIELGKRLMEKMRFQIFEP